MVNFDVPHVRTHDVFEGLLPSSIGSGDMQLSDSFDQILDQHVTPHDVEKVMQEEQEALREDRAIPKWVQKTL